MSAVVSVVVATSLTPSRFNPIMSFPFKFKSQVIGTVPSAKKSQNHNQSAHLAAIKSQSA
ncbi:hypothetical protein GW796_00535 [archaeon]|nr:hypothetical protein [archaeon]